MYGWLKVAFGICCLGKTCSGIFCLGKTCMAASFAWQHDFPNTTHHTTFHNKTNDDMHFNYDTFDKISHRFTRNLICF